MGKVIPGILSAAMLAGALWVAASRVERPHASSPAGLFKAMQVAAVIALPKDIAMRLSKE